MCDSLEIFENEIEFRGNSFLIQMNHQSQPYDHVVSSHMRIKLIALKWRATKQII